MKIKFYVYLFLSVILFSCSDSATSEKQETQGEQSSQEDEANQEDVHLPEIDFETAKNFIPKGYHIVSYEEATNFLGGNFDGDNTQDFAVMVASDETVAFQDAKDVRVMIFEQQPDNNFKKVAESGNLEGYFIHNAPTSQLHLNKNVISIKRQDMRFDNEWKFQYDKKLNDYILIGSEYNSYGNATGDGSGNRSTNYLSGKQIDSFNEWDMKNEKLNELPSKTSKVPSAKSKPVFLKAMNSENYLDL